MCGITGSFGSSNKNEIIELKGQPRIEKWILRKAFEHILPHDIVWRVKEQFDEGSGSVDMLEEAISSLMTYSEAEAHRRRYPDVLLRSTEECYYHKIFMDVFKNPAPILANVGRWTVRPDEVNGK
jgi:asparagine synthase (glutamine-hydrolysing)